MIGGILQLYAVYHLMFRAPKGQTEFPLAEPEEDGSATPYWTERWGRTIVIMLLLVAMAYVVPLVEFIVNAPPGSPPFVTW
jgi:cytochrome c oxidase subunit 1